MAQLWKCQNGKNIIFTTIFVFIVHGGEILALEGEIKK